MLDYWENEKELTLRINQEIEVDEVNKDDFLIIIPRQTSSIAVIKVKEIIKDTKDYNIEKMDPYMAYTIIDIFNNKFSTVKIGSFTKLTETEFFELINTIFDTYIKNIKNTIYSSLRNIEENPKLKNKFESIKNILS